MIIYKKGNATFPTGDNNKIIAHICNDIGLWGAGFVLALSRRWKSPEIEYKKWNRGYLKIPFQLGEVIFVQVENGLWVANIIGQHGIRPKNGVAPIRYGAVKSGLKKIAEFARAKTATIHMPRIGCGLAGGKWQEVEKIIIAALGNERVVVYDQ